MFWYLVFATVPVWVSLIVSSVSKNSIKHDEKTKRTFLMWCGFAMFLIISLRHYEVGSADSLHYYEHWEEMSLYSYSGLKSYIEIARFEPGYCVFVWVFSQIFPNGQILFILTAFFFTFAVCRYIYINSKDPELSFVMYICLGLYTFMVQGLRQSIAMSICLFAIEFIKKRKIIPFVLLVLLAFTFHQSAIVFLLAYFLYGFKINLKTMILGLGIAGVLLASSGPIAAFGNQFFGREYEGEIESGGYVAVAIYFIILTVSVILAGNRRKNKDYTFFVLMTFVGAVFYLMRYTGVGIAERISYYFMFGQMIALPGAISRFDKSVSFAIKCVVITLCFLLFAYRLSSDGLVAYRFFWQ